MNSIESDPDPAKTRKAWFFRGFRDRYALGYVRKHFHAVRLSLAGASIPTDDSPMIVVLNHPSWWDPMICAVLTREFGEREHYGVIDSAMLKKYGFFRWIGFFGIDPHSLRGAAQFLRVTTKLLSVPRRVFWITAQGEFADVRARPLNLRSGVGHLANRLANVTIFPMAIEYGFGSERTPNAFVRFGPAIHTSDFPGQSPEWWTERIEASLTDSLNELNREVITRDARHYRIVLGGRTGVGGLYGLWQRMKCWVRGRAYRPAHNDETLQMPL